MSDLETYKAQGQEVVNSFTACQLVEWLMDSVSICRTRTRGQADRDGRKVITEKFTIWTNGWDVSLHLEAKADDGGQK